MLNMGSININGTSQINEKVIVYFGASYNGGQNKSFSATKNISDMDTYLANQKQCDADYSEFESAAMDIMSRTGSMK